ncbi:hypothetical protein CRG98_048231 [Punica granatum]|uniref:Uncharacterized protein n=1 Tax=Punica granatum TaxID=22663 RepID=A0A2I0HI63_PUNGR|nr:hypothetical protein CRG98_048231 [Punica granatum]
MSKWIPIGLHWANIPLRLTAYFERPINKLRQRGLKEPGVRFDRSNGLQENRLVPTVSDRPIEFPGDIQTRFTRSIQMCLPHRPHLECDGEPGLDPIPRSGCTHSVG